MDEKTFCDKKSSYCGKIRTKLPQNFSSTKKSMKKQGSNGRVSSFYALDLCDLSRVEVSSTP